jgi:hypothetical protein
MGQYLLSHSRESGNPEIAATLDSRFRGNDGRNKVNVKSLILGKRKKIFTDNFQKNLPHVKLYLS